MARKGGRKISYKSDFGEKDGSEASADGGVRWWQESNDAVAGSMFALAAALESSGWTSSYYMQFICARLLSNRVSPAGFGYSMTRRVGRAAQSMVSATWTPPTVNIVGMATDVFKRKVFSTKPWLEFLPAVKGNFKTRSRCKAISQFVDAAFEQLNLWETVALCGIDCMQYPSAFVKVGQGIDGKLSAERVLASEMLVTPEQAGAWSKPRSIIRRMFVPKADLVAAFANTGDKVQDNKVLSAIRNAPGVYPGIYSSIGTDYSEVAALLEGHSLPLPDGTLGRHTITVGELALVDEEYNRNRLPYAKLDFVQLSNEWMGQSAAEILLPMQRYIDRLSAAIDELEQRWSFPRWFVETSSNVDTDQFGSDFVEYSGTAPNKDSTNSVPPELYTSRQWAIETGLKRLGVTLDAASGKKEPDLSSGLAIMAQAQIDDSVHIDLAQRYERFIQDIGELIIEECADLKPEFKVEGRQTVKWSDVSMDRDEYVMRPFPMSRLPQQPSARFEMINRWYQDGTISRAKKLRLENMPDLQTVIDAATSSADWVENALDEIVETGKYKPPLPYLDVKEAQETAQARFLYEHRHGLEEGRLRTINKFIAALREMSPPPAPAMIPQGAPGPQPGPGPQTQPGPVMGQQTGSAQVGQPQ